MEVIMDAIRMIDDGLIEKVGSPRRSQSRPIELLNPNGMKIPLIRGPFIDYDYILCEEKFPGGKKIVSEGSYGNWIWVILEGKALMSRETDLMKLPLAYLGEGAFVGTFGDLLFGEHTRSATVTAVEEVHSALLDTHRLAGELMSLSSGFRACLLDMPRRLKDATDNLIRLLADSEMPFQIESRGAGVTTFDCIRPLKDSDMNYSMNSNVVSGGMKENLNLEPFQYEYAKLSRTFRNLIQYTAKSLALTAAMAAGIQKRRCDPLETSKCTCFGQSQK